jgi:hypothetical protein
MAHTYDVGTLRMESCARTPNERQKVEMKEAGSLEMSYRMASV